MNATLNPAATSGDGPAAPARTNRGVLDSLTIRRRTTGEQAAARAALMRRLRIALPVLALLLIAAFFLTTRKGGSDDAFLNDFADLNATTQNLRSARPQFSGVDSKGNPYEITADSASQKPESKEIVELDQPRAVTVGGGQQSVVEAKSGVFNTDDKRLLLKDGVTFEHAIGRDNYVLKSSAATVSIDDQTVESDDGVTGDGPGGATLKADRMQANNRDGGVVFEGSVSMRLYPKQIEGSADAAEKQPVNPENGDPKNGESND
jgi:lipopolysaccharide export system protein LptC